MRRSTLAVAVVLVCLPLSALAKKPTASPVMKGAKVATVKTEDCAAYIRSKAPLPEKLAELQNQIADNLEAHVKWQSAARDQASRAEVTFLQNLVKQHRALAAELTRLSTTMKSAQFAAAPHDMSKMDPKFGEQMAKQEKLEREFAAMVQKDAHGIAQQLRQMKVKTAGR